MRDTTFTLNGLVASSIVLAGYFFAASARAEPSLTALTFLPGDDALAPAAGKQLMPEIAAGDDTYLAVWVDDRGAMTEISTIFGGPNFDHHIGTMWDLFAARIDADGNLIDQTPIPVSQDIQNQAIPVVAWNGSSWLVVFTGQEGLACCPEENRYAVRIAGDGTLLDPTPITLATGGFAGSVWDVTVGSDGTNWLVVWSAGNQVTGMRVAPDGTVLDPAGVVLHTGGSPGEYDITFANGEYFLVWSTGGQTSGGAILGLRLTSALTPVAPAFTINRYAPSVGRNARVATNGTEYFVAWWEDRYYQFSQLAGSRVSGTGAVLDPGGVFLTEAWGITNYDPDVVWDGTNWLVLYDRYTSGIVDLFAARVTTAGVVLDYDTNAIPVSSAPDSQNEVTAARLGAASDVVVLWRDWQHPGSGNGDIVSTTIAPGGVVGVEQFIALGSPRQSALRLAANETGSLAVYLSETGLGSRVLVQRVNASGTPIDLEPVEVASGGAEITHPSAAWNGSEYLVVWESRTSNDVFGRRLASDLTQLDPGPVLIMSGNRPDVAAVDGVFLVVATFEDPHEIRRVYSARIRGTDGALLDAAPHVVGANHALFPRVAAFPDRWLVVWERHPTHDNPSSAVRANTIGTNGIPGTEYVVSGSGDLPAVAVSPSSALVVWHDQTGQTTGDLDVLARRVTADGTFLDSAPFAVSTAANAQFDASVAWTGTEYVAAFGDFRNEGQNASKTGDIYAARVDETGDVLDPDGFVFSNEPLPEMFAGTTGTGGSLCIGASIFRQEPGQMSYRIGTRASEDVVDVPPSVSQLGRGLRLAARPNPVRRSTTVTFELSGAASVHLAIYDVTGRHLGTIVEGPLDPGRHAFSWDRGHGARRAKAGVYFARLTTMRDGRHVERTQRLVAID